MLFRPRIPKNIKNRCPLIFELLKKEKRKNIRVRKKQTK